MPAQQIKQAVRNGIKRPIRRGAVGYRPLIGKEKPIENIKNRQNKMQPDIHHRRNPLGIMVSGQDAIINYGDYENIKRNRRPHGRPLKKRLETAALSHKRNRKSQSHQNIRRNRKEPEIRQRRRAKPAKAPFLEKDSILPKDSRPSEEGAKDTEFIFHESGVMWEMGVVQICVCGVTLKFDTASPYNFHER